MGFAAVTEANYGDFTVKLKSKRSRDIDDIMEDVRQQVIDWNEPAEPQSNHQTGQGQYVGQ